VERVPRAVTLRAIVAVALLGGFYAVGLLVLGCLVWLSVQMATAYGGAIGHDVSYAAGGLLVALAVPVWQLLRDRPEPPDGVPVSEEQAPALWLLVRELAGAVGTRVPDEIRLSAVVNAGVSEDAGWVGLRRGRRILYLGVPLLWGMTVPRIRAVLAHELGHYAGGHTVFGAVAYRGGRGILRTIDRIGPRRTAGVLLRAYAAVYFLVALAVMRRMEVEADAAAARIAGAEAAGQALAAIPGLRSAWDTTIRQCAETARDRGVSPRETLDAFAALVATGGTTADRDGIAGDGPAVEDDQEAGRWDSHPPLAERLRLLAEAEPDPVAANVAVPVLTVPDHAAPDFTVPDHAAPDVTVPDHAAPDVTVPDHAAPDVTVPDHAAPDDPAVGTVLPGTDVVADREAVWAALAEDWFVATMSAAAQDGAEREAESLYAAANGLGRTPAREGLGYVLDVLGQGRADELGWALASRGDSRSVPGEAPDPRALLVESATAALAAHLVSSGLAYWDLAWSRPSALRSAADEPLVPRPVVADACADPRSVAALREYLRALGVDEAVTAPWADPGRRALDPGQISRPPSGGGSSRTPALLLPDEFLLIVRSLANRHRPARDVLRAGLVAGVLAELRLRGRVELTGGRVGTCTCATGRRPVTGFSTACSPGSGLAGSTRRTAGSACSGPMSPRRSRTG
jgi:Zn-dependent protease with chaperone function